MSDTRSTIIPMLRPLQWSVKLTHSLTLKDGTELVTLADARDCLRRFHSTVTTSPGVARGTDRAIKLVRKAAKTGAHADRKAATDQVAIVLRWRDAY